MKIFNLIYYSLCLKLYCLMRCLRPKEKLWVFGAWFGEKYFDNPRVLFEYVRAHRKDIKAVWITKDISIVNNKSILYLYSFRAFKAILYGEVFFVTHSKQLDLACFINDRFRKIIQLWHGIPIKKIGFDDNRISAITFLDRLRTSLFPFFRDRYAMVIASSEVDKKNMASAFGVNSQIVKVTGYPRNDLLFKASRSKKFKVLYAPTLRDKVDDEVNLFDGYGFQKDWIIKELEKNDIFLDIKMHPANSVDKNFKKSVSSPVINFLESKIEINEILGEYSILISDYSGIYVDYLLLDRPIIFAPFDFEKYQKMDRELYFDYDSISPGPKCMNWLEVINWIKMFKEEPFLYSKEREKVKKIFHKYDDANSSARVLAEVLQLVDRPLHAN